jgi:hypothetical protein
MMLGKIYRSSPHMSTIKNDKSDLSSVLGRLQHALKKDFEYQVGEMLGISKTALAQRKKRGSVPVDKIELVCRKEGINVNWALTGEGGPFLGIYLEGGDTSVLDSIKDPGPGEPAFSFGPTLEDQLAYREWQTLSPDEKLQAVQLLRKWKAEGKNPGQSR